MPTEEFEINDDELRTLLNEVGHSIGDRLPSNWGFCLLLFSYEPGATFYISNAERGTMITALQEFIRKQKERGH